MKEKEIFIFVNRRSSDKVLNEKIKGFQKKVNVYFQRLKLTKEIQMVYKNFRNINANKSMETLKQLLGLSSEILSSFDSFHSDFSANNNLTRPSDKKTSISQKPKPCPKEKKKGGCRIF